MTRLVCDVLEDMRQIRESIQEWLSDNTLSERALNGRIKKAQKRLAKLTEEAQDMVNKMEARLFEYKGFSENTKDKLEDLYKECKDLLAHRGKYKRE